MKYRSFGKTDLKVSEIGFGCAPIGYTVGFEDDKACIDSVRNAIDLGLKSLVRLNFKLSPLTALTIHDL